MSYNKNTNGGIVFFLCFLLLAWLAACSTIGGEKAEGKILAKVGQYVLYEKKVQDHIENTAWKDEKEAKSAYIQQWILKHLTIRRALQSLDVKALGMEEKINDYRYAVFFEALMEDYLSKHLEETVSEEEIFAYYTRGTENFLLTKNVLRYLYLKLPKSEANMQRYANYVRQNTPEGRKELESYCQSSQSTCLLKHEQWDEYIRLYVHLPKSSKLSFEALKKRKMWTFRDEAYVYYLHVLSYKSVGDLAPLSYVRELIVQLILSQKRKKLQEVFNKTLLEEASRKNEFIIYGS